jgi:hypothetical protein
MTALMMPKAGSTAVVSQGDPHCDHPDRNPYFCHFGIRAQRSILRNVPVIAPGALEVCGVRS